jgi:hypothetical protein
MDYLPSVTIEPAHIPVNVPYLGDDSGQLNSIGSKIPDGGLPSLDDRAFTMDTAVVDMAAFLQMKFFFGLLRDIMGEAAGFRKEEFEKLSTEACLVLTAAPLPTLLKRWKAKRPSGEDMISNERKIERHLRSTKAHIQYVASAHSRKASYALENMSHDPLTPIILSIQTLLETLWDAQFAPEGYCRYQDPKLRNPLWMENAFVHHLLTKAGWQHSEIETMPKDIRYRYYLSFFRQRPARALRRASSALRVIVRERYSTRHVHGNCHCESLSTALPHICGSGSLVHLVSLSSNILQLQTHRISLLSSENRVQFVAFSHVRSDGLGSSTTNSLPACQVSLLQKLSNELLPEAKHPVPFYIDTLCVPLAGRAKRHALRNMRALFGLADKVLVLDSDLRRTRSGRPQEDLTRMRISVWMKRLWTVQECAVSHDVYFRFKDCHLSLNELLEAYDTGGEFPLLRTQSLKDRHLDTSLDCNLEHLLRALALLSDDMQLAESLMHETTTVEEMAHIWSLREGYDKWKLRRILRIGHLALPQMRYFSEPNESTEFQAVVTTVLAEYNSELLESQRNVSTFEIDAAILLAKLKRIQSIKFLSDEEAMLSPPKVIDHP